MSDNETTTNPENPIENATSSTTETLATTANSTASTSERLVEYNGEKIEVPENFWDKDSKSVNLPALLKSQADLRKKIGEDHSPKDGAYEVAIPEEYKEAIDIDKESTLYKSVCAFAKEHGLSQDEFNDLVRPYIDDLAAPFTQAKENIKTEDQKLGQIFGNKKQEVIERVNMFIQNSGISKDPEIMSEIGLLTMTANGIKALNMIATATSGTMPMVNGSMATSENLNDDQLRELMNDPRYWRDHEPNFVKKISDGFQRLYPNK